MASKVSSAKATLSYPLFAADFDPDDRGYLVVGGGGGESKTGVPNHVSVLDVSNRASLSHVVDIDLSRDEDSVQSLGNLATKDGLITLAGVNSSESDQNAGKNEHLRSFEIKYPPRKKPRTEKQAEVAPSDEKKGESRFLGKRAVFRPSTASKKETYQRLLRLSPANKRHSSRKRIGAVATGLAKDSEVVVINATTSTPDDTDILARIDLPSGTQAEDLDIATPEEESSFSIAYCTDYDIYEQTYKYDFSSKKVDKTPNGPRRIHQMPFPDTLQDPQSRPRFRALRFLNPQNLIALCNKPNKAGAELRIFHLYPTGPATLLLQKSLPTHIRQAVSLDLCSLDTDKKDGNGNGNQQVVIAVAGQDVSIEVYTTNYSGVTDTFSPFKHYATLSHVHPQQMTKLVFSPFYSPSRAPDIVPAKTGLHGEPIPAQETDINLHPSPQYIRLASISYANTVVVHTFPLSPLEPTDKNSRYVLSHPNDEAWTQWAYVAIVSLIVLITAFLLQAFMTGFSVEESSMVGPFNLLPRDVRNFLDQPARNAWGFGDAVKVSGVSSAVGSSFPSDLPGKGRLREMLSSHQSSPESTSKALVLRSGGDGDGSGLAIETHPDKAAYLQHDAQAKHWDELGEEQKAAWKERLVKAGEWVENEGESVLMGVLFSEYADLVGTGVREALGGGV